MKSKVMQLICRLLIFSMLSFSFQAAHAGMIGVDQVAATAGAQAEREALARIMSRSDVAGQFHAMGLDAKTAADRVAALTDEEVRSLSGKLQSVPAGASGDWGWGLLAVIIIAGAIYYFYGWKGQNR